jgi:two-component system cell cycle sensor histidine kinase/response regulator CckA
MLQRTGYKVLEAGNGPEALQVCAVHGDTIHIVVTDVVMPQMNGQALAQQLISLRPELKVLFMSGYTEQVIVMSDVLQPSMAFLQKPFTPHALACKVRALLDHTS